MLEYPDATVVWIGGDEVPRHIIDRPRDFGDFIAGLREEQGISQESLAERLGFTRSYLSELESGKTTVQLMRLFRVLHALGVSVEVSWTMSGDTTGSNDG